MKRLPILLLIFLLFPLYAHSAGGATCMMAGGGAKSCPGDGTLFVDQTATHTTFVGISNLTDHIYTGTKYSPTSNTSICAVEWSVRAVAGSADDWTTEIWTLDGSGNLTSTAPTGTCTSTKTVSAAGDTTFDGMSCLLVSGTNYGIVLTRHDHAADGTNYIDLHCDLSDTIANANWCVWKSDLTVHDNRPTWDASVGFNGFRYD